MFLVFAAVLMLTGTCFIARDCTWVWAIIMFATTYHDLLSITDSFSVGSARPESKGEVSFCMLKVCLR